MRVSHEIIYRSLDVQGRGGLRRDLVSSLRTGRALRKTRRTRNGADASPAWSASRSGRRKRWTAPRPATGISMLVSAADASVGRGGIW